jgi:hypothetical protein
MKSVSIAATCFYEASRYADTTERLSNCAWIHLLTSKATCPLVAVELDVGVTRLRLTHQPPFVAAIVVQIGATAHMAGLSSVGRIGVSTNFDLEDMQAGSIVGLEEIIQNFALLCSRIVEKQARGSATATQTPYSIERATRAPPIDTDARCSLCH